MKGVELPINVLIIVSVALIVLLAIVGLFFTGWTPFPTAVGLEGIKNAACRELVQEHRCAISVKSVDIDGFDADKDGLITGDTGSTWNWDNNNCASANTGLADDNLAALCECHFNIKTESQCKVLCGCP